MSPAHHGPCPIVPIVGFLWLHRGLFRSFLDNSVKWWTKGFAHLLTKVQNYGNIFRENDVLALVFFWNPLVVDGQTLFVHRLSVKKNSQPLPGTKAESGLMSNVAFKGPEPSKSPTTLNFSRNKNVRLCPSTPGRRHGSRKPRGGPFQSLPPFERVRPSSKCCWIHRPDWLRRNKLQVASKVEQRRLDSPSSATISTLAQLPSLSPPLPSAISL